jgi:hypothetical protein
MASHGGKRKGAGRKAGSKDKEPRIKRADVLAARQEEWDDWERKEGAMAKVRKRLLAIVEDPQTSARDAIAAANIMETRGLGKPTETREQLPQQQLLIIRPNEVPQLSDPNVIEIEVRDVTND